MIGVGDTVEVSSCAHVWLIINNIYIITHRHHDLDNYTAANYTQACILFCMYVGPMHQQLSS